MPACWVFLDKLTSKISECAVSWRLLVAPVLNHRYEECTLWLQGRDSNPRPPAYEAGELTNCSTLRYKLGSGSYPVLRTACKRRFDLRPHIPRPNGGYNRFGSHPRNRNVLTKRLFRDSFTTGFRANWYRPPYQRSANFLAPSIVILLYHKNFFMSRKRKSFRRTTPQRAR